MTMIAESVERMESIGLLTSLDAEFAQGLALGEPRPL